MNAAAPGAVAATRPGAGEAEVYLACDLGAESGRVLAGWLDAGKRLAVEELHRFPNAPLSLGGTLRWDALGLYRELLRGLRRAAGRGWRVRSVSVDSWGADYALYNAEEPSLGLPWCYRDGRTEPFVRATLADPAEADLVFAETGIQFWFFNTQFQLRAELARARGPAGLADGFLGIGDYLNYLLGGVARAEESFASTTQLYDPAKRAWSARLQERFGLPARLFPRLVPSGTVLGPLRPEVAAATGLPADVQIVATCSHDTGAAVAAVPARAGAADWAYLISGTWSLLGTEREKPLVNPAVRAAGFSNEVGHGGSVRLLRNLAGLWLLQEMRRDWAAQRGEELGYADLVASAGDPAHPPFRSLVHPNAPRFARPGGMLGKIAAYCQETGQPAPNTSGEFARCIFESLALLYAQTLASAAETGGNPLRTLHIVGGGSRNRLLNQWTADATGCSVRVGPTEATAIGNLLLQASALGALGSLAELRATVAHSFPPETLRPRNPAPWRDAAARFARLPAFD